jgi:hypothetical protein
MSLSALNPERIQDTYTGNLEGDKSRAEQSRAAGHTYMCDSEIWTLQVLDRKGQ